MQVPDQLHLHTVCATCTASMHLGPIPCVPRGTVHLCGHALTAVPTRPSHAAPPPVPAPAGTQWHPEKPPYEFGMDEVPHSLDAIRVSQHLSNVFMEQARLSNHRPESKEQELAMQIYSTAPIFSARFEVSGARTPFGSHGGPHRKPRLLGLRVGAAVRASNAQRSAQDGCACHAA